MNKLKILFLILSIQTNYPNCDVFGRVKFVEFGEDYRVKFVEYGEDCRVEICVNALPSRKGRWRIVKYGEDFRVKIVEYGEDFRVKKMY